MEESEINQYFESLPIMIKPQINVEGFEVCNIELYKGKVIIVKKDDTLVECFVTMHNNWLNGNCVEFEIKEADSNVIDAINNIKELKIDGGGIFQGRSIFITRQRGSLIKGKISFPFFRFYEANDPLVTCVYFHLFNFRRIFGGHARTDSKHRGGNSIRLDFITDDFEIDLYCNQLTEEDWHLVKDNKFGLTYTGVLKPIKGFVLSQENSLKILGKFGQFISFLNGSYSLPRGIIARNINNEDLWVDYSNYITDPFPNCYSWLPMVFNKDLRKLWCTFYHLGDQEYVVIERVIDWYVKSNVRKESLDSSFISLQISFELLFNLIIIEKKKMIVEQAAEKLRASDKIRLLLSILNADANFPDKFYQILEPFLKINSQYNDFPYLFTEIRNSYTHASKNKRKNIGVLKSNELLAVLNTGLYFVELLILYILGYKGIVSSRVSQKIWRGANEEKVPWE